MTFALEAVVLCMSFNTKMLKCLGSGHHMSYSASQFCSVLMGTIHSTVWALVCCMKILVKAIHCMGEHGESSMS